MRKLTIEELIRARCHTQGLFGDYPNRRIESVLDTAWYLTHKYSINSRLTYNFKQATSAIRKKAVEIVFSKKRVFVSYRNFALLYILISADSSLDDPNVLDLIGPKGYLSEADLRDKLQTRSISPTVNPHLSNFQLVIMQRERAKEYWLPSSLYRYLASQELIDIVEEQDAIALIIEKLLNSYPFLSVDLVAELTHIPKFELGRPLHYLLREKRIQRIHAVVSGEYFTSKDGKIPSLRSSYPSFVLDSKDPLMLILRSELSLKKNQYFFFSDGTLQCGFDLKKKGMTYLIVNFQRCSTTTLVQDTLMKGIIKWGRTQSTELTYDQKNSPQGEVAIRFLDVLLKRGYSKIESGIHLHEVQKSGGKLTLQEVFRNLLAKTYDSIDDYIDSFVQVESLASIYLRFSVPLIDFSNYEQMYGVGGRFSLVSKNNFSKIVCAEAKQITDSLITKNILGALKEEFMLGTQDIIDRYSHAPEKIISALRYLESHHRIMRVPSSSRDMYSQIWQLVEICKGDKVNCRKELLLKLLTSAPPLTALQITRYFGWTLHQLQEILPLEEVKEGYFLKDVKDIQYFIPATPCDESTSITFYPSTEPIALVLPELIQEYPEIQPIEALSVHQEVFFILDDFNPIGYFVVVESTTHYNLKLYLISDHLDSVIPVLESINSYTQSRFLKNGKLLSINNSPLSEFEKLHFAIELLGFEID